MQFMFAAGAPAQVNSFSRTTFSCQQFSCRSDSQLRNFSAPDFSAISSTPRPMMPRIKTCGDASNREALAVIPIDPLVLDVLALQAGQPL